MRLEVKITDERVKHPHQYHLTRETEDYTRAEVAVDGAGSLVASTLRALADDLDPRIVREPEVF